MTDFVIIRLQTIPKATVIWNSINHFLTNMFTYFHVLKISTEELCTKEENNKAGCTLTFKGQCIDIKPCFLECLLLWIENEMLYILPSCLLDLRHFYVVWNSPHKNFNFLSYLLIGKESININLNFTKQHRRNTLLT